MHSLYHSLLALHPKQLTPIRCAESTIGQLLRYFEDVVLENSLSALVIESLPTSSERSGRELTRVKELGRAAQNCFLLVSAEDVLSKLMMSGTKENFGSVALERIDEGIAVERFVVIADARFSVVLASVHEDEADEEMPGDLVIWTFEPDIVYSALEYLMARVTAEHPFHANVFAKAVQASMPKATSLQLTLGVTTKLARLLQQQAEREIAVNRIATTIRNSPNLEAVLQTAANEVGRALSVECCAVRAEGELVGLEMTKCYLQPNGAKSVEVELLGDALGMGARVYKSAKTYVIDGDHNPASSGFADAVVPLVIRGSSVGFLLVRSGNPARVWADTELLLLHTVADQLAVAVNQAQLFAQMEQQALTDALTGCYNRRSFELQLERDLRLAMRMRQPLSLLMLDLDNFKAINDSGGGHQAGDNALRTLADILRAECRAVDTPVRFGGDEFAVILPQANAEGGLLVAERLRCRLEQTEIPGYGPITASFGLATFPAHATSRESLVVAADRALYVSKHSGRNQVSLPPEEVLDSFLSPAVA